MRAGIPRCRQPERHAPHRRFFRAYGYGSERGSGNRSSESDKLFVVFKPPSTRRELIRTLATGAGCIASSAASAASPAARVIRVRTISKRPDLYHGWPTVARRSNGELIVVCSGGRPGHVCPFGWVEMMRSRDGGESWSWPRILTDSAIDDRDAGVCETAEGSLLVTTFTSLAYVEYLNQAEAGTSDRFTDWTAERISAWQSAHERIRPPSASRCWAHGCCARPMRA